RPRPGMNWVTWKYPSAFAAARLRYFAVAAFASAIWRDRICDSCGDTEPGVPCTCPVMLAPSTPEPVSPASAFAATESGTAAWTCPPAASVPPLEAKVAEGVRACQPAHVPR